MDNETNHPEIECAPQQIVRALALMVSIVDPRHVPRGYMRKPAARFTADAVVWNTLITTYADRHDGDVFAALGMATSLMLALLHLNDGERNGPGAAQYWADVLRKFAGAADGEIFDGDGNVSAAFHEALFNAASISKSGGSLQG